MSYGKQGLIQDISDENKNCYIGKVWESNVNSKHKIFSSVQSYWWINTNDEKIKFIRKSWYALGSM